MAVERAGLIGDIAELAAAGGGGGGQSIQISNLECPFSAGMQALRYNFTNHHLLWPNFFYKKRDIK